MLLLVKDLAHGRRIQFHLVAEERQPARGATAACAPGGRVEAVHAATQLGAPQLVGQVLREFLIPIIPPFLRTHAHECCLTECLNG